MSTTKHTAFSRRTALAAAGGVALTTWLPSPTPARAADCPVAPGRTIDKAAFDEGLALLQLNLDLDNTRGALAWGTAYAIKALVTMYRGSGDLAVLERFDEITSAVLATRDSEQGVTDYRGVSAPLWRTGREFATGSVTITGATGTPLFDARYGLYAVAAGLGTVTITHDDDPRYFTLTSTNRPVPTVTDVFAHLSMDSTDPDYFVDRLHFASPNRTKCTARDLRSDTTDPTLPPVGTRSFETEYHHFVVDQGMILDGMAEFAALAVQDPRLGRLFPSTVAACTEATATGLAAMEHVWRENADGEAWYVFDPESPVALAGADVPHNHSTIAARCYLHLAAATGQTEYRDRAAKLLTRFRNDLRPFGSAFTWNYFDTRSVGYSGWTPQDRVSTRVPSWAPYRVIEDTGHATLETEAAATALEHGAVFTHDDLVRLARNYADHIARRLAVDPQCTYEPATTAQFVDGSGPVSKQDASGRWSLMTEFDARILPHASEVFQLFFAGRPMTGGHLYNLACLAAARSGIRWPLNRRWGSPRPGR